MAIKGGRTLVIAYCRCWIIDHAFSGEEGGEGDGGSQIETFLGKLEDDRLSLLFVIVFPLLYCVPETRVQMMALYESEDTESINESLVAQGVARVASNADKMATSQV